MELDFKTVGAGLLALLIIAAITVLQVSNNDVPELPSTNFQMEMDFGNPEPPEKPDMPDWCIQILANNRSVGAMKGSATHLQNLISGKFTRMNPNQRENLIRLFREADSPHYDSLVHGGNHWAVYFDELIRLANICGIKLF